MRLWHRAAATSAQFDDPCFTAPTFHTFVGLVVGLIAQTRLWVPETSHTSRDLPAQDGGRGDEQPEASACREQSGECGDQGTIGPGHPWAWCAPSEHGELVAQDQDLDLFGGVGSGAEHYPAQELGEH